MQTFVASLPVWAIGIIASAVVVLVIGSLYAVSRWAWKAPYAPLLGVTGILLSLTGSAVWSYFVATWIIVLSIIVTILLFVIGLTRPETKDDKWHWAALAVGAIGPLIGVGHHFHYHYDGTAFTPWGLIVFLVVGIVVAIFVIARRRRRAASPASR